MTEVEVRADERDRIITALSKMRDERWSLGSHGYNAIGDAIWLVRGMAPQREPINWTSHLGAKEGT